MKLEEGALHLHRSNQPIIVVPVALPATITRSSIAGFWRPSPSSRGLTAHPVSTTSLPPHHVMVAYSATPINLSQSRELHHLYHVTILFLHLATHFIFTTVVLKHTYPLGFRVTTHYS
jgi:hypothetical protein